MPKNGRKQRLSALALSFAALFSDVALAKCTRVIQVPVAALGQSVVIDGGNITGIYPEILRGLSDREGCKFAFSEVPRARLEILFASGRADLLIPASKTPKRDASGTFVPLIQSRATLISLQSARSPIKSMRELQENPTMKVALVRGYDYGPIYQDLMNDLAAQGRLVMEVDALSIARLMKVGSVQATIMSPTILEGVMQGDERVSDLVEKLRIEPLEELPWGLSGVYISNATLDPQDRAALQDALDRVGRSGEVWKSFVRFHNSLILKGSIRPL